MNGLFRSHCQGVFPNFRTSCRSRIRQGADRDSSIPAGFGHSAVILICRCTAEVVLAESWDIFWKEKKSQPKIGGVKAQKWRENEIAALLRVVCHGPEQCLILMEMMEKELQSLLSCLWVDRSAFAPHSRRTDHAREEEKI